MESLSDAIGHLTARGFHAQSWDCPAAPGALAVAAGVVETPDGIRILRHMALVIPAGPRWRANWEFGESEHRSLEEAVAVAAEVVSDLRAGRYPHQGPGLTKRCT
jgi:hypothetical protein